MDKNSSARNGTIDILRFVGLSLIILAHVSPPDLLFNLRCFDVPMMLFVSGLAYSNHRIDFSASFLVRRTLRLIVPVYVFLTAYFLLTAGLKYFAGIDFGIAARHIVGSYLLMDGIGFVWIIRIFLLIALLTPVLMRFERAVHSDVALCLMLAGVSALLTAAIRMRWGMNIAILRDFVYYAVGYSVPFVAGLRVLPMKGRRLKRFFLFTVVAVLLCGIEIGGGKYALSINAYKYPPQAYYLFYGLLMSLVCYMLVNRWERFWDRRLAKCLFIGRNTIWIYLYHIPLIQVTGMLALPWWLRYLVVYGLAVAMCYAQVALVERISSKHDSPIYKYLKG